jgi:PAS domain-containing protein
VLKKLANIETEVQSDAGGWYLRRMLPYRTQDDHIAGVVITFIDITTRKQEEEALRRSEARLQELIEALPGAVYITDAANGASGGRACRPHKRRDGACSRSTPLSEVSDAACL